MKRIATLIVTTAFTASGLALTGCQGNNNNPPAASTSDSSAQVGSGAGTGTSGAGAGEVSPSTQPSRDPTNAPAH